MTANSSQSYVGRFAPSPTGPLHFGSLVAALASYLDARHHHGRWLLRVEDLDPPREVPGAAAAIMRSLEAHGLHWDGAVMFQSQRQHAYWSALEYLDAADLLYPCYCSRKMVAAAGGVYPGTCRRDQQHALSALAAGQPACALRVKTSGLPPGFADLAGELQFDDLIFGPQRQELASSGDFIVLRKDGLFAYQLAVVVDDMEQGINHVIRGSDLLDSTVQQIYLFGLLGGARPRYGHVPVALDQRGQKLSKQQGAAALDDSKAPGNLCRALAFLGQPLPEASDNCAEILDWAVAHWNRGAVQAVAGLPVAE